MEEIFGKHFSITEPESINTVIYKVNKTEKEFLSRVTYAECLYILTPANKYCDKIKELSVLKICEIIEKLLKENEELKNKIMEKDLEIIGKEEYTKANMGEIIEKYYTANEDCVTKQKIKDKIEKEIKYHKKNILDIENITMLKDKTAKEEAEIEFNKYIIVVLKKILQELLKGD